MQASVRGRRGTRQGGGPMGMGHALEGAEINQRELHDVFEMLYTRPEIQNPRRAMHCMFLSEMFNVTIPEWGKSLNDELRGMLAETWLESLIQIDDWLMAAGIAPYVWERIPGTDHVFPRVPEYTDGTIKVSRGKLPGTRVWQWYWIDTDFACMMPEADPNVHFRVSALCPLSNGTLRSPLASLLHLHRLGKQAELCAYRASEEGAVPKYIFQKEARDTSMETGEVISNFGEEMAGFVQRERARATHVQHRVNRASFRAALAEASAYNNSGGNLSRTSTPAERRAARGPGVNGRSIVLDEGYRYVSPAAPKILLDPEKIWKKLATEAWTLYGFPMDFAQPSSRQASGNIMGMNRFFSERSKDKGRQLAATIAQLFSESYGRVIMVRKNQMLHMPPEYLVPGKGSVRVAEGTKKKPKNNRKARKPRGEDDWPFSSKLQEGTAEQQIVKARRSKKRKPESSSSKPKRPSRVQFRPLSVRQRYAIDRNISIEVEVQVSPTISYPMLRQMKLDGVVGQETFVVLARNMAGMTALESDIDKDFMLLEERAHELDRKRVDGQIAAAKARNTQPKVREKGEESSRLTKKRKLAEPMEVE